MLDQLHGAIMFSCLDLATSFWQVPLEESTRGKTTFICSESFTNTQPWHLGYAIPQAHSKGLWTLS